ncbi:MAG: serine/threonine-protein kinase [Planctomycetota bacterium]
MNPTVPGYQIRRELGKGGMGMVYLAHSVKDQCDVALKILPPHLVTPITARRFQREGIALQNTDHPNIVKVFDVGAKEGQHYIAMEYVAGAPLSKPLREHKKGFPLDVATSYAAQVASALRCIHERGMTHRDLKPGNVMLTEDGQIKLLDFGLVQVEGLTMLTATGNIVGTPRYMSPEQCAGVPLDSRSDIYSFGVLLYELVTGTAPFDSENIYDLLEQQKTTEPVSPAKHRKDLPPELADVILHCLKKAPEDRPQTMREVLAVLAPGASELPSDGPLSGIPAPVAAAKDSSGTRQFVMRGAVFTLLIAVAAVVALFSISHPKVEALRDKVTSWLPGAEEAELRDTVEQQYQSLVDAENSFDAGKKLEASGDNTGAFDAYLSAHRAFRTQPRYLHALVGIASDAGKVDAAKKVVESYLSTDNAEDPGRYLATWLKGLGR